MRFFMGFLDPPPGEKLRQQRKRAGCCAPSLDAKQQRTSWCAYQAPQPGVKTKHLQDERIRQGSIFILSSPRSERTPEHAACLVIASVSEPPAAPRTAGDRGQGGRAGGGD